MEKLKLHLAAYGSLFSQPFNSGTDTSAAPANDGSGKLIIFGSLQYKYKSLKKTGSIILRNSHRKLDVVLS